VLNHRRERREMTLRNTYRYAYRQLDRRVSGLSLIAMFIATLCVYTFDLGETTGYIGLLVTRGLPGSNFDVGSVVSRLSKRETWVLCTIIGVGIYTIFVLRNII
jgi:hypothetical protein